MENYLKIAQEEEQRWQDAYDNIVEAIKLTTRYADEDFKEAKRLTQELVSMRREEDQQQIMSDEAVAHGLSRLREGQLNKLELLLEQPYFARLECEENGKRFSFYLGMASFPKKRIIDWREAPIAKLYYEYNEGDDYSDEIAGLYREGQIIVRRGFKGKGRELYLIECPHGQIIKQKGEWKYHPYQVDNQGSRIRSRAHAQSHYLPPILSLITADQYAMITSEVDKPLLIEGIAGSGKTTVALHRLAWLLHNKNSQAKAARSFVLVFNQILKLYIKECLPELGLKDVKVLTYSEWVHERLREARVSLPNHPHSQQELTQALWAAYEQGKLGVTADHLVVDEIQDLSPQALQVLTQAVASNHCLTLVGDFGQQIIEGGKLHSFKEVVDTLGLNHKSLVELHLSFRSTKQILELAQHVRHDGKLPEEASQGVFVGPEPEFIQLESEQDYIFAIQDWIADIKQHYPHNHSAILCRTPKDARHIFQNLQNLGTSGLRLGEEHSFSFEPGLTVTSIEHVKGLEFRNVLIANPSDEHYRDNSRLDRNLLYVAITRAEEHLDFLLKDQPTPLLPMDHWHTKTIKRENQEELEWLENWAQEKD